jgi:hypothetical protein
MAKAPAVARAFGEFGSGRAAGKVPYNNLADTADGIRKNLHDGK